MSSEPPLLTPVLSVLSRLHSLVSESLHERKKAMGLEASRASVDLSDVQTRAMGTLGALEVLDGSFDDFPLVKEILLRVKGLNLPWEDIGVSCAQAAAEGSFGVVESQLLGLLWSPRFESLKATLLKEIEACVEVLMKQAGSGGLAKSLPPLPPMRQDPSLDTSISSVATFDELVYLTTGPSLAEVEPLLATAADSRNLKAQTAAFESLSLYPPSDILHCQYFLPVKQRMLAGIASADPRIQMIALRYLQKLFVESIDVSPVQACEMCSELIRSCVSSFSGVCAHDPGEVVSSQTTRFTLLKYKLLHSMVTQLSQTWVYVPEPEVDRLYLSLFTLFAMQGGVPMLTTSKPPLVVFPPFALFSLAAATVSSGTSSSWFWEWCLCAKPREQLFHLMHQTGFLSIVVSCARRPAPLTPLLLSRAWTAVCQESLSLLGCVIGFAEGRQLFPLTIPPTATTDHRTTDADRIAATIAVVDAGCTPDASCNNRIRHATALTRTSRAVGASVSVNDVVSLVLQALSTRANSNISNFLATAVINVLMSPSTPPHHCADMIHSVLASFLTLLKTIRSSHPVSLTMFTSVTRVVVAVLSLDGTATVENESLMSVMTALLETLPQCKPDLAPALLQSLSASIQRLRRHTAMCFALYEQQHVLEALAVAIYSTEGLGASLSSALLSVVDTPLGLIWLNNTGLVEFAAQELFARLRSKFTVTDSQRLSCLCQLPSVCDLVINSGYLEWLLSQLLVLFERSTLCIDLHCPGVETMYSLMPLLSLERLLVSPVMMETISASEAPSAKAFVSFLTAFISGGNRLLIPEEYTLIACRLLAAASTSIRSGLFVNEWLKVSKSLEDQLTPVAPLFHGSLESLPEGFQYIPGPTSTSTTTQPTAVSDLMASVSPSRCAMLRVLQQLVIIGGWDEVTLLPSDPDSMTSLPDSIDALSRFSAASPIAIDGSRCLLADVDGPSLLTHLSHCVCCGNVDLYTPVMRGLLDSVIGDTASSVAPPPSHDRVYTPFLALLSFYQQRLQQVYGIEAEGIQPVLGFDFMAATVQLTLNNPTLTSSFSSWIHNPKPMGPGVSRGADLQLLWSSGAMSEDALLNSSFHCCLLHAIEWLVTSAAPSTALSFQRAGVSISQLCASWMSQCFWNVCNLSDVLMLAFILPSVCGVKWFVYACSALLLSADASVIREGIIAGEDAATLHRRCHRLAIHWQSLTADMKAFEASHDTAVDALLALTGNKMS